MVGLAVRQVKHAFLQNWVATVPQRQREAKLLLVVLESVQKLTEEPRKE
jgi:hypothetical protein